MSAAKRKTRYGKRYTETFRRAAVAKVLGGESQESVASSIDVAAPTLQRWLRDPAYGGDPDYNGHKMKAVRALPTELRPSNAREAANAPRQQTANFCPQCGYDLRRFKR